MRLRGRTTTMDGPKDVTAAVRGPAVRTRLGALTLMAGLLTACGGGDGGAAVDPGYGVVGSTTEGGEAAEELVIVIEDFAYTVPESVPPGADVVVRNLDGVGHTVTADDGDAFDVAVGPGEEVTLTAPSGTGKHPFHCIPHPAMTGTLVVEEGP